MIPAPPSPSRPLPSREHRLTRRRAAAAVATLSLIGGTSAMLFSVPALAAPATPQHPATFTVQCQGEGTVTLIEATGAAGFTAESPVHGTNYVAVSGEGRIYMGTEPIAENLVHSFAKSFGTKNGLDHRVHCIRVNTDVYDGQTYTAFETYVLAKLPNG